MAAVNFGIHRKNLKVLEVLLVLMLCLSSVASAAEILIITNKNVGETTLTRDQVQDIFLGKKVQWADNNKIHVSVLKDFDIHNLFLKEYLHKTSGKWKSYWKRMVFTGRGLPPKSINSEAELIDYVANTDGAIGYVTSDGLPENTENMTVNILQTRR